MNNYLCLPIVLVDFLGSFILIVISGLCLKTIREITVEEPENFLYGYLYWLFLALFAFSISRSLGHIIKYILYWSTLQKYWRNLSPVSGSLNTALFILIASITLFFHKMKRVMEKIEFDKKEIERVNAELLKLSLETEKLVTERTRAELALLIAHEIRNPIMVIGGIIRRLFKKGLIPDESKEKLQILLKEVERLDEIVREFEFVKKGGTSSFSEIDLNKEIIKLKEQMEKEALKRSVEIIVIPEKKPLAVHIDASLIRFALYQCLKVLLEASKKGQKIGISLSREKFGVNISCFLENKDPSKLLPQTRDIFSHIRPETEGIKLSTVRQIIKEHGGNFSILEDTKNTRLSIEIFLPFKIGTAKTW